MNGSSSSERSSLAERLRGFSAPGILAFFIIVAGNFIAAPLSAVFVLLWAKLSETPWREIGYARPRSWIASTAGGLAGGCVFKLLMKAIVMPLFGADPINHAYHYLVGNRAAIPQTLFLLIVVAGFGEETFYRGYLFERLGKALGRSAGATLTIVFVTSVWFGVAHYPMQGLAGMEQAIITGLVFGSMFAATGRLWTVMCAHAAFDLTAYAIIYWDLESKIAHLFFN